MHVGSLLKASSRFWAEMKIFGAALMGHLACSENQSGSCFRGIKCGVDETLQGNKSVHASSLEATTWLEYMEASGLYC